MSLAFHLRNIVEGFRIESTTTFMLLGQRYHHDPSKPSRREGPLHEEAFGRLAYLLYTLLHCRLPLDTTNRFNDWIGVAEFTERLSEANSGTGTWQHGWSVHEVETNGTIGVEKYGIQFWAGAEGVRATSCALAVGEPCRVRVPREYRDWIPGFYLALGNADDVTSVEPLVRIYWHVRSSGAPTFVASVSTVFNEAAVPFQSKVPNDPLRYGRSDAGVLYLPKSVYGTARPLLVEVFGRLRNHLRPETSFFAKRIAPGVCLAEDPGDGASFGQHRADILAAALCDPLCLGTRGTARIDIIHEFFGRTGLDLETLFLNPGSNDVYDEFDIEHVP
jgi:HopA1 effector protein family